ncbi:MAG: hypothetical protein EOQ33_27785 [Mesorhizobium sp.]|nr:MAG: hypothetical protein EOQ33_27785 [Mesorhizobium sp.]
MDHEIEGREQSKSDREDEPVAGCRDIDLSRLLQGGAMIDSGARHFEHVLFEPGHVVQGGLVVGSRHYDWRDVFLDDLANVLQQFDVFLRQKTIDIGEG